MPALKTLDKELLAAIPPGKCVAISPDQERVLGTGDTIDEALQEARRKGEDKPFVIRVPQETSALIL